MMKTIPVSNAVFTRKRPVRYFVRCIFLQCLNGSSFHFTKSAGDHWHHLVNGQIIVFHQFDNALALPVLYIKQNGIGLIFSSCEFHLTKHTLLYNVKCRDNKSSQANSHHEYACLIIRSE